MQAVKDADKQTIRTLVRLAGAEGFVCIPLQYRIHASVSPYIRFLRFGRVGEEQCSPNATKFKYPEQEFRPDE
jgi:hypothetical protein